MAFTTRIGGVSKGPFMSLNLGYGQGDDEKSVDRNREIVSSELGVAAAWAAPNQVHGSTVVDVTGEEGIDRCEADAVVVRRAGLCAAVVTADCVPVLLRSEEGVAAIHAGWRGLCAGVVANAVSAAGRNATVAVGPSIGVCHYEVGPEVLESFSTAHPNAPDFSEGRNGRLYFDLQGAVIWALAVCGVEVVQEVPPCTFCEEDLFSHRRDGLTGRQAALAWI